MPESKITLNSLYKTQERIGWLYIMCSVVNLSRSGAFPSFSF